MSEEKIKKAIGNANSNVSIEKMENSKKDLELVREALESSRNNESFLYSLVKLVEKEEETKNDRKTKKWIRGTLYWSI